MYPLGHVSLHIRETAMVCADPCLHRRGTGCCCVYDCGCGCDCPGAALVTGHAPRNRRSSAASATRSARGSVKALNDAKAREIGLESCASRRSVGHAYEGGCSNEKGRGCFRCHVLRRTLAQVVGIDCDSSLRGVRSPLSLSDCSVGSHSPPPHRLFSPFPPWHRASDGHATKLPSAGVCCQCADVRPVRERACRAVDYAAGGEYAAVAAHVSRRRRWP